MNAPGRAVEITLNHIEQRFEAGVDGKQAVLEFYISNGSIVFTHTEVPEQFEGGGVGSALVRAGLEYARKERLYVVPACPFVQTYLRRHPQDLELVKPETRRKLSLD
jgi:uncharacterized protein